MKVTSALLTALAVATVNACGVPPTSLPRTAARTIFRRADAKMYTLETAPGVTIEVTEEEKLAMMDVSFSLVLRLFYGNSPKKKRRSVLIQNF